MRDPSWRTVTTPTVMSSEQERMCPTGGPRLDDLKRALEAGGSELKMMLWMAPEWWASIVVRRRHFQSVETYGHGKILNGKIFLRAF